MEWINNGIEHQINVFYAGSLKGHPQFPYTTKFAKFSCELKM